MWIERSEGRGCARPEQAQKAGVQRKAEGLGPLLQQRLGAVAPLEDDDVRDCESNNSKSHRGCHASRPQRTVLSWCIGS